MAKRVLITGASGLVGSRLSEILLQRGYEVVWLSRSKKSGKVPSFAWDVNKGVIDGDALDSVDTVIHLAGAGVADSRWTESRKQEIINSRVRSTRLLYDVLKTRDHRVRSFLSASGIGYYGPGNATRVFTETDPAGNDFLARVTKEWEASSEAIESLAIRVVKLRTGIVLSSQGGALKSIAAPIRFGFGAPLGRGDQYQSWIHIDDLCEMYVWAMEDAAMRGPYNAVGVQPVTNYELTRAIARALGKPLWLPAVPAFLLRLALGEMADIVVTGSKVSPEKILKTGFKLQFTDLEGALRALYH